MSATPEIHQQESPPPHKPRRGKVLAAIAVLAVFGAGAALGAVANNHSGALSQAQHKASAERATAATLRTQAATLHTQLVTAQQAISQANAKAQAKAHANYAARTAALNRRAASLNRRARAITAAEGQLQTAPSSSVAPAVSFGCKILRIGTSEEFNVTTVGGGNYQGTVYISFYDYSGSGDVFPNTTVNGTTPVGAWRQVPAADIGASAEPSGCIASAG
jgi:hypothetical protein